MRSSDAWRDRSAAWGRGGAGGWGWWGSPSEQEGAKRQRATQHTHERAPLPPTLSLVLIIPSRTASRACEGSPPTASAARLRSSMDAHSRVRATRLRRRFSPARGEARARGGGGQGGRAAPASADSARGAGRGAAGPGATTVPRALFVPSLSSSPSHSHRSSCRRRQRAHSARRPPGRAGAADTRRSQPHGPHPGTAAPPPQQPCPPPPPPQAAARQPRQPGRRRRQRRRAQGLAAPAPVGTPRHPPPAWPAPAPHSYRLPPPAAAHCRARRTRSRPGGAKHRSAPGWAGMAGRLATRARHRRPTGRRPWRLG